MEKYREFGDKATGINPFTAVIAPKPWGLASAAVMFPLRLFFCTAFALLLFVTDCLAWPLHVLRLGLIGAVLLGPLQRLWLRGGLFFAGHVGVVRREGGPRDRDLPRGGDLLFANLQSVWDAPVLEVALGLTCYAVAFPVPASCGGWDVKVFGPSPWQRWAVAGHIRRTGTLDYVTAAAAAAGGKGAAVADLAAAQCKYSRVPVVFFAEGTCSNGKGVLAFAAPFTAMGNNHRTAAGMANAGKRGRKKKNSDDDDDDDVGGDDSKPLVSVAAITYDTPAVQNVTSEVEGPLAYLFRVGKLVCGTTSPAWGSPLFPSALVQHRGPLALDGILAEATADSGKGKQRPRYLVTGPTSRAAAALQECVCMGRGGGGGSGGWAMALRRRPLAVGFAEKEGFIRAYLAVLTGGNKKQ